MLALAEAVGVNEAARRTGTPSGSLKRWRFEARQKAGVNRTEPNRGGPKGAGDKAKKADPDGRRIVEGKPTTASPSPARAILPPPEVEVPDADDVQLHPALTTEQSITVHLLLAGHREEDIARALRIGVHRIRAWRKDPPFIAVYDAGLAELHGRARKDWLPKGLEVLDSLHAIAVNPRVDGKVRVAAGTVYLDRVGFPKTERVEVAEGEAGGTLADLPTDKLQERIAEARARLRVVKGGSA